MSQTKLETFELWLRIAKSDLKGARILYKNKQYRASYFFFQQAAEKSNKGYALKYKLATEDTLFDAKHDLFKMFRKILNEKVAALENSIVEMQSNNSIDSKNYLKTIEKKMSF